MDVELGEALEEEDKEGMLDEENERLFLELMAARNNTRTGGRR